MTSLFYDHTFMSNSSRRPWSLLVVYEEALGRRRVRMDEVKLHLGCLWERLDGGSWQKRLIKLKWR